MGLRALLVALIAAATAAFVVGVALERGESHEEPAAAHAEGAEARESPEQRAAERAGERVPAHSESGEELKPLGVDVEAWPFVAVAALVSLGLAAAAYRRPDSAALLLVVAAAMLAFTVLDVREVFHQHDEENTGLAFLAAVVAALHLAAAVTAGALARTAPPVPAGPRGPAGSSP
jgi:Flp pilus assembly protein TadB